MFAGMWWAIKKVANTKVQHVCTVVGAIVIVRGILQLIL